MDQEATTAMGELLSAMAMGKLICMPKYARVGREKRSKREEGIEKRRGSRKEERREGEEGEEEGGEGAALQAAGRCLHLTCPLPTTT
jgi:hypothetical protein